MSTAAILLASGMAVTAAAPASATAEFNVSCVGAVNESVTYIPMTAGTVDLNFDSACTEFAASASPASGLTPTPKTNSSSITSNIVRPASANSSWSITVTGTPVSEPDSTIGIGTVVWPTMQFGRIVFVTPEFFTNANLGSLSIGTLSPSFTANTTSYTATSSSTSVQINAAAFASKIGLGKQKSALVTATCDTTPATLTYSTSTFAYSGSCTFTAGTTKNIVVRVTALDGTTTKDYTVAVTVSSGGGGGGDLPACNADLLSSSSTIKGVPITIGQSRSSDQFGAFYTPGPLRSSVTLTEAQATGSGTTSITTTDGSAVFWLYIAPGINSFSHRSISGNSNQSAQSVVNGRDFIIRVVPETCAEQYYWVSITVGSGSNSPSGQNAQQLAAAQAAIQAAIAAAIAKAKTTLHGTLQGDKPGTLDQYRAADYKVNNDKVVTKVNAAVLKLPLADRENVEKIAAIIKVENFVDLVSTPATQKRVTSKALVELGLVAVDNPNKTTIANALKKADAASLNSIEKIQEAIKAELAAVKERKDLLAEIKARIAARKK